MQIRGLHHNAYRCWDSEGTRKFHEDFLGLPLVSAFEITNTFAALIQFERCCGVISWRRATCEITAPGAIACATIRPFSRFDQRRRRTTPLRISTPPRGRCAMSLVSNIMNFTWRLTAKRATPSDAQQRGKRAPLTPRRSEALLRRQLGAVERNVPTSYGNERGLSFLLLFLFLGGRTHQRRR